MDSHLLIKIIHMSLAGLGLIFYFICGVCLFLGLKEGNLKPKTGKILTGLLHSCFALLLMSGGILLWMKNFDVQPWFYAKVILFVVMFSSLLKALRTKSEILLVQRRAGWVIAGIAFAALISLVIIKPVFS